MSAANRRGAVRRVADYYPTPAWCVWRLLEVLELPGGRWLEPAVGDGAIVRAVNEVRGDVTWSTVDVQDTPAADVVGDYLAQPAGRWDVVLTNPPFRLALPFVQKALGEADHVAILVRFPWISSRTRRPLIVGERPDVYVLPDRPSFDGSGNTDATDYAWLHFGPGTSSRYTILETTTPEERRRPHRQQLDLVHVPPRTIGLFDGGRS